MKPAAQNPVVKNGIIFCFEDVNFCYSTDRLLDAQLEQTGRDVNYRSGYGKSALHIAAEKDLLEAAKWLINKGADLEAKDISGLTPLHMAATLNSLQVARLLIAKGADKNIKNNAGKKPIHYAKRRGHFEMVALLQ